MASSSEPVRGTAHRRSARLSGEFWAGATSASYALTNVASGIAVVGAHPLVAPVFRSIPTLVIGWAQVLRTPSLLRAFDPRAASFVGYRATAALLLSGICQIAIGTVGLFYALSLGGVVLVVPVVGTQMLWGALLARLFLGERLRGLSVACMLGAVMGIAILAYGEWLGTAGRVGSLWAIPLALIPATSWAVAANSTRYALQSGVERYVAVAMQTTTGVIVLLVAVLVSGLGSILWTTSLASVGLLLLSGVLATAAVVGTVYALSLTTVASFQVINGLSPVIATLIAVVFLGEHFNSVMAAGTLLTVTAVIGAQWSLPGSITAS